jgi:hypothetical protein
MLSLARSFAELKYGDPKSTYATDAVARAP